MKKHGLLFLMLFLCFPDANAQQDKENYALLWELSGNGLQAPSYIFGSMHVREKAVFEFPDSLYYKLAASDAFANEVHFDSAMTMVFEKMFSDPQFLAMFNKDAEKPKDKLEDHSDEKNEMPTILDAWLMNIAKRMGKEIYGLESLEDQLDMMLDSNFMKNNDEYMSYLFKQTPEYKKMLGSYAGGNLADIEDYLKTYGAQLEKDYQLIERNFIQAESIERIAKEKSLFGVIGAAHLPGEKGVLNILKKKGYVLRPISAEFTGNVSFDDFEQQELNWRTQKVDDYTYQFETPNKAVKANIPGVPVSMYFSANIGTGNMFLNMAIPSIANEESDEEIEARFIENLNAEVVEKKEVQLGEITVRDIYLKEAPPSELPNWRLRVIRQKNTAYIFQMASYSETGIRGPEAEKYFQSFKSFEAPSVEWNEITDEAGGFKAYLPGNPQLTTRQVELDPSQANHPYFVKLYQTKDNANNNTYLLRYSDFPLGQVAENDSIVFASMADKFTMSFGEPILKKKITLDGYPGLELKYAAKGEFAWIRFYIRGNRFYALFAAGTDKNFKTGFFDEFKLIPFKTTPFVSYEMSPAKEKILLFQDTIQDIQNYENLNYREEDSVYFYFSEDNSGATYLAQIVRFSPYYDCSNPDSTLQLYVDGYLERRDSVSDITSFLYQDIYPAKRLNIINNNSQINREAVIVFRNKTIYLLTAYFAKELKDTEHLNTFFNGLSFQDQPKEEVPPKVKLWKDLASSDSNLVAKAHKGLSIIDFKKTDLPEIYKAIDRPYFDDHKVYNTKIKTLELLEELNDGSIPDFLHSLFLKENNSDIHSKILNIITRMKTRAATDNFLTLFEAKPSTEIQYTTMYSFQDSLDLFKASYPHFSKLAHHPNMTLHFFNWSIWAMQDSTITNEFMLDNIEQYEKLAEQIVETPDLYYTENSSDLTYLIHFFSKIPYKEKYAELIRQLYKQAHEDIYLNFAITKFLLDNKIAPGQASIDSILASDYYQVSLLEVLYNNNRKDLVDKKLFDQRYLADKHFEQVLYDEFYNYKLEFLEEKELEYKNKKQNFYLYKIIVNSRETGETTEYPAMTGPYPDGELVFNPDITDYVYQPLTDTSDMDESWKKIIGWYEK